MHNDFLKFAKDKNISSTALHKYTASMTPYIVEERRMHGVSLDVFSRLMIDRVIFLGTEINDIVANIVNAQLLFLESVDSKKDIHVYINSPGGECYSGLAIYDTMQFIKPDINTVCIGMAASMASVILCGGVKGKRSALRHSRIMIHQPMGGTYGQNTDLQIYAKEMQEVKNDIVDIYVEHTKIGDSAKVNEMIERDRWIKSVEAIELGIIDKSITKR